ncbi:cobalamin biosynthesis protein [Embleya sp. AB8]|uniref:cobalamin biosynthesis protein n=1 Tax=Embleya sp. AB8 TaxID=3156304 RepID=UPI003C74A927
MGERAGGGGRVAESGTREPDGAVWVVGIGVARGVGAAEVRASVRAVLARAGLEQVRPVALVTVAARAAEPGLVAGAALLGLPLIARSAADLAEVPVPNPAARTLAAVGTPGVAEPAARLGPVSGGPLGELVVAKTRGVGARPRCTVAVARHSRPDPTVDSAADSTVGRVDPMVDPTAGRVESVVDPAVGRQTP